jgi:hypothetical protein
LFNETQGGVYINLSDYDEFFNYRATNPAFSSSRQSQNLDNKDFLLKR